VVSPVADAWRLVYQPQRAVFAWLGFPGTEAMAKLGRKCVPESLTIDRCLRLRRSMRDENARSSLAHLPRINGGVIDLVTQRNGARTVTPQLLAEVAVNRDEDRGDTSAPVLEDAQRMARVLRRRRELEAIRTRQQLREAHDEMVREMNERKRQSRQGRPFPEPPIPGVESKTISIVPITTCEQLAELGREQHNCVASYAEAIRAGRVYIYRVACGTEVCTLSVQRNGPDRWTAQEMRAVCNQNASLKAWRFVYDWIAGQDLSVTEAEATPAPAVEDGLPVVPLRGVTREGFEVIPVTTLAGLMELSLGDYRRAILDGRMYAFRVNSVEGIAAVLIRRGRGVMWELARVSPAGTHSVRGETLQAVSDWLRLAQRVYR
jgi:hypothetical protein